jgi:hypothetical protein
MSLRSMLKAARLAASDTHPSRTQRSRRVSRAVPLEVQDHHAIRVQDHHGVVVRREAIGCSAIYPQVPAAIAKLHSFWTIQMYPRPSRDRSRCSERLSEVDRPRCRS